MKFFRSKWLQRILLFLFLILLNASPFDFTEKQGDKKDDFIIQTPHLPAKLDSTFQKIQIKYGFDVLQVSVVTLFKKIISQDYIPGTSFDPLSAEILTCLSRSPPYLMTML